MAEVDDNDTTNTDSDRGQNARGRDNDSHRGRLSYEELYARYKGAQEEAKSHRLNSDRFAKMADEVKADLAKLKADSEKSVADAKAEYAAALKAAHSNHASALESLKGEHTTTLEQLRAELNGKVNEANTKAGEALTKAQQKALTADLRVAATLAGMKDLDGLKLLDMSAVEVDDDGNLTNGEAVMTALKESKAYLFADPPTPPAPPTNSGNPTPSPTPKKPEAFDARTATPEEFRKRMDYIRATNKIPT